MRAGLAEHEPTSLARWNEMRLYEKVLAARGQAEPFVFHDGPPYANGLIHVGHLLNKVLKDFVVRSRNMSGRRCPFVPGWDCHGLPIEHKVMTDLVESGQAEKLNALTDDERRMAVRGECRKYADKYRKLQAAQLRRLLTLADYGHPYLTLTPDYEKAVLEVFADLVEQGLVYRALKSVHWSIENQTALAEAELEYYDKEDVAVFVDFEAADREAVARAFGVELDRTPSLMIWTTTPWTLPANLAIAIHERFRYALVNVDGNVTVIAAELVDTVTRAAKSDSVQVLAETDGTALVGLTYRHPFCDRTSPIVHADYVTLEDGTGLVHTAPGHGEEDHLTALREGFDVYCPVRADGTFDDTVPDWLRGMSIWKANKEVVDRLRASGHLFLAHAFSHSYPHDWRSKTPVIFRATEQWFIGVDRSTKYAGRTLRQLALEACQSQMGFIPEWGRNRLRGMLESRPDWCISRQRAWGLPIPAFELPNGEILLTAASVRAVADVFAARGSDAWFTEPPEALLAEYDPAGDPDAPESLGGSSFEPRTSGLRKMYDIFDVWFESGSSWHAAVRQRGLGFPVDLYLEGSDQHRGWFQLSLLPSLGVTGQSPFRAVLTHGFTVDKDGRKMSKSLGNTIEVEDLLKRFGADVCRWWVSSLAFDNDIKMDLDFFEQAGETYRKVRNTLRFLLSNLFDAPPRPADDPDGLGVDFGALAPTSIDAHVLSLAAELEVRVRSAYERYAFRRGHQLLYEFCNETLSAFYCAAVKDRLYCDRPDSSRRRTTQAVMRDLLEVLCRLFAPMLPHTADEAYRALFSDTAGGDDRCVHLQTFLDLPSLKADGDWPKLMQLRQVALKALEDAKDRGIENPLDAEVVLPDREGLVAKFQPDLADMLGVSRVRANPATDKVAVNDLRDEPRCDRCWRRDVTTAARPDGGMLCDRCADAVGV
jgi:isoleucyl-tRNA synthetase